MPVHVNLQTRFACLARDVIRRISNEVTRLLLYYVCEDNMLMYERTQLLRTPPPIDCAVRFLVLRVETAYEELQAVQMKIRDRLIVGCNRSVEQPTPEVSIVAPAWPKIACMIECDAIYIRNLEVCDRCAHRGCHTEDEAYGIGHGARSTPCFDQDFPHHRARPSLGKETMGKHRTGAACGTLRRSLPPVSAVEVQIHEENRTASGEHARRRVNLRPQFRKASDRIAVYCGGLRASHMGQHRNALIVQPVRDLQHSHTGPPWGRAFHRTRRVLAVHNLVRVLREGPELSAAARVPRAAICDLFV